MAEPRPADKKQQDLIDEFYNSQRKQLALILASKTARYLLATQGIESKEGLDEETLNRWQAYLADPHKEHPYLKKWFDLVARHAGADELRTRRRRVPGRGAEGQ